MVACGLSMADIHYQQMLLEGMGRRVRHCECPACDERRSKIRLGLLGFGEVGTGEWVLFQGNWFKSGKSVRKGAGKEGWAGWLGGWLVWCVEAVGGLMVAFA